MRLREIMEKIKSKEFALDLCEHQIHNHLIKYYDRAVARANGTDINNQSMQEYYRLMLEKDYLDGESFYILDDEYCFGCGQHLSWVLDGTVVRLRSYLSDIDRVLHPISYNCPYNQPQIYKGKINVRSPLIIANYFNSIDDTPGGSQYNSEWSLNCTAGIVKRAKYKEERNVAYGQMSNMSIGVFLHENKKSIIIGNAWDGKHENYELIGDICLTVWRWEATDLNTVKEEYNRKKTESMKDAIKLDVPHGTWLFEHYCNYGVLDGMEIYAKMQLQEQDCVT